MSQTKDRYFTMIEEEHLTHAKKHACIAALAYCKACPCLFCKEYARIKEL